MSVSVEININTSQINNEIEKAIEDAMQELAPILQRYAQTNHNYENRTGYLTQSTIATSLKNYLKVEVGASYGQYIHEGTRYISPDPWIENTFKDNEDLIMSTINKHIEIACNKINS